MCAPNYARIITLAVLLQMSVFLSDGHGQISTATERSYKPTIRLLPQYNFGAYSFYQKGGATFGGLLGIRAGVKATFPLSQPVIIWAYPWGRITYFSWGSSKENLDSDGHSGSTTLTEYELSAGVSIWGVKAFGGYRRFRGTTSDSYDWWTDYNSNIAWDGSYAEYSYGSHDELKLSGYVIGTGYTRYSLRGHEGGLGKFYSLDIDILVMLIKLGPANERFYFVRTEYAPVKKGWIWSGSFGMATIPNLIHFGFGVGYQI